MLTVLIFMCYALFTTRFGLETLFFGVMVCITVISLENKAIANNRLAPVVLIFIFTIHTLNVFAFKSATLSILPTFDFSHTSMLLNKDYIVKYSQGPTKFYALGALAALSLCINSKSQIKKIAFILLGAQLLIFSLAAGARGDFIILLFLFLTILGIHENRLIIIVIPVAAFFVYQYLYLLEELAFFIRLLSIIEHSSLRANLVTSWIEFITVKPHCLIIGCGIYSFDNYTKMLFPHNFILELVNTFGIFISLFLLIKFIVNYQIIEKKSFIKYSVIYLFLVSLKSTPLAANWLLIAWCLSFLVHKRGFK